MRFCFYYFVFFFHFTFLSYSFSFAQNIANYSNTDTCKVSDYPGNKKRYLGVRLYHENDFIVPGSDRDNNYTGGVKLEIITNLFKVDKIALLKASNDNVNSISIALGFTVFTPHDIGNPLIVYNDRPFASYHFIGFGVSSISKDAKWKLSYELQLGAMGMSFAGKIQEEGHDFFQRAFGASRDVPRGWPHQIGYPGRFAANLNGKVVKSIFYPDPRGPKKNYRLLQISASGELNLGQYLTNISVEPTISFFNWNHNFGDDDDPSIEVFRKDECRCITKNKAGFYLFFGIRPKFVIHNTTLTGKWLDITSVHTISSSELDRFFMEYNFGFSFRWAFLRLGYNILVRGK